jgi:UDP-N-acetylglucosamine enolpyruvyl transferase
MRCQTWVHWIPNIKDAETMIDLLSIRGAHLIQQEVQMVDVHDPGEQKLKTTDNDSEWSLVVNELA